MAARSSPHEQNPFENSGLDRSLIEALADESDASGIRTVMTGLRRAVARTLHPDIVGHDTEAYRKLSEAHGTLESLSDPELMIVSQAFAKSGSRPRRSAASAKNSGMELVKKEYIRTGSIVEDMAQMAYETKNSLPSAKGFTFMLEPIGYDISGFKGAFGNRESRAFKVNGDTQTGFQQTAYLHQKTAQPAYDAASHRDRDKVREEYLTTLHLAIASQVQNQTGKSLSQMWRETVFSLPGITTHKPRIGLDVSLNGVIQIYDAIAGTNISQIQRGNGILKDKLPAGIYTLFSPGGVQVSKQDDFNLLLSDFVLRKSDTQPGSTEPLYIIGSVSADYIQKMKTESSTVSQPVSPQKSLQSLPAPNANQARPLEIPLFEVLRDAHPQLESFYSPLMNPGDYAVVTNDYGIIYIAGQITEKRRQS